MTTYFKKCASNYTSIVDALKSVGIADPSKKYRKKIAKLNGISSYSGTESQNVKLLNLLKKGKLIKSMTMSNAEKFVDLLNTTHNLFLSYGNYFYYSYANAEKTFAKAKEKVQKKKKTGTTCVVPPRWALTDMGISCGGFYGKNGKFAGFSTTMQKYLKNITESVSGKTIKQAVDQGLLKPGDIICFKGHTHTVVYTGVGYKVFDGGGSAQSRGYSKVGIILDYSTVGAWKNEKISEILRWK